MELVLEDPLPNCGSVAGGVFFLHSCSPIGIGESAMEGLRNRRERRGVAERRNPCLARVTKACWFTTGVTGTASMGRGGGGVAAAGRRVHWNGRGWTRGAGGPCARAAWRAHDAAGLQATVGAAGCLAAQGCAVEGGGVEAAAAARGSAGAAGVPPGVGEATAAARGSAGAAGEASAATQGSAGMAGAPVRAAAGAAGAPEGVAPMVGLPASKGVRDRPIGATTGSVKSLRNSKSAVEGERCSLNGNTFSSNVT
jgi:hypothetical protein